MYALMGACVHECLLNIVCVYVCMMFVVARMVVCNGVRKFVVADGGHK